jgi:DNA-binding response OmpR family regulator
MAIKTVLIVEDDKGSQDLVIEYLDIMGLTGYLATNGLQGLEMAKEVNPDLILLDLMMPRFDGLRFLEEYSQSTAMMRIPVIVTSAVGSLEQVREAVRLGARDYIRKPISFETFKQKLDAFNES